MESNETIVKDLRKAKPARKPTNEERASAPAIRETIHLLAAELLLSLRKEVKGMTPNEKTNLLGKLLTYVAEDSHESVQDASFEVLAEKYLKIEMRIKGVDGIPETKSKGSSKNSTSKRKGSDK